MTTRPRLLSAPALSLQAFRSRATARASHPFALADLANDAAGGHPSQRWTKSRFESGSFHWFYESASVAKFLVVRAVVAQKGTSWAGSDGALLTLTATDGTNTASSSTYIPDGLRGDRTLYVPPWAPPGLPRRSSIGRDTWVIDLDTIRAHLSAATRWRFKLGVTTTNTYVESWQVEELPRGIIDTADDYGQLLSDYLPRAQVIDGATGLQRILTTLESAYDDSLATYHAMSPGEASPWTTTSTTYAPLTGDEESAGVAAKWVVRCRRLRGDTVARVRYAVRYRTVGMSDPTHKAYVRLHSAAGASPYVLQLADTAGVWTDSGSCTAEIAVASPSFLDTIHFDALTASGTLDVSARTVWRYPSLT